MKNIKKLLTVKEVLVLANLKPVNKEVSNIILANHTIVNLLLTEVIEMASPLNRPNFQALIETYNDMCVSLIVEAEHQYVGYNLLGGSSMTSTEPNISLLKDVFVGISAGLIGARKASRDVYWSQPNLSILKDTLEYYPDGFKEANELLEDIIVEFNKVCPRVSSANFDATNLQAYVASFSGAINRYKSLPRTYEIKGYLPVEFPSPQLYEVRISSKLLKDTIATDLNTTKIIDELLKDEVTLLMSELDMQLFSIFSWAGTVYKSEHGTVGFRDEMRTVYSKAKFVFESVDFNPIRVEHLLGTRYTPFTKANANLIKSKFTNYISEVYHD